MLALFALATAAQAAITCPKPTDLSATEITANSVMLGWTENGEATTWEIQYSTDADNIDEGTTILVTENPYTLTGLTAQTTYYAQVRAVCGEGDYSNWSQTATFTTEVRKYLSTIVRTPDDYDYSFVFPSLNPSAENNCYEPGTQVKVKIPDPNSGNSAAVPGAYFYYLLFNGVRVDISTDIMGKYYSFTMPEEDVSIVVRYELRNLVRIIKTCEPEEGGTISGPNYGKINVSSSTVTLTATPNEGYVFKEWQANGVGGFTDLGEENGSYKCSFRAMGPGSANIKAVFERRDVITLFDNDEGEEYGNLAQITDNAGAGAIDVMIEGRTIYRDGRWNTICLPFNLEDSDSNDGKNCTGTLFEGAIVKRLDSSSYTPETKTLTLNFEDSESIWTGGPYLVRWDSSENLENLVNPVFKNVEIIDGEPLPDTSDCIDFLGTFSPVSLTAQDHTVLYLGGDSKLYYPGVDVPLNAFRGYFQLKNGLKAGDLPTNGAKNFVLNFGDETTEIVNYQLSTVNSNDSWYSIDGRKLQGEPTQKGIYIHRGKKMVK